MFACGSDDKPISVRKPCRATLLGLPLEVRQRIYTYCFLDDHDRPLRYMRPGSKHPSHRMIASRILVLLTCRQILIEARQVFAQTVAFLPGMMKAASLAVTIQGMPEFIRKNLRTVQFSVTELNDIDFQPQQLVLLFPNLRTILIEYALLRQGAEIANMPDHDAIEALIFKRHGTGEESTIARDFIRQLTLLPKLQVLIAINLHVHLPVYCWDCHGDCWVDSSHYQTRWLVVLNLMILINEMKMVRYHDLDMDQLTAQLAITNKAQIPKPLGLDRFKCEGSEFHSERKGQRKEEREHRERYGSLFWITQRILAERQNRIRG